MSRMFNMQLLTMVSALLASSYALKCLTGGPEGQNWGPSCSNTTKTALANVCYVPVNSKGGTNKGCLPKVHAALLDISAPACSDGGCWCLTDNCNTEQWAKTFFANYTPPPQCWTGIAGANQGPTCTKSALYSSTEYKRANCGSRSMSKKCVENNKGVGEGDGCSDHKAQNACESYVKDGETRDKDKSYDGTTRHCRWVPEYTKVQLQGKCEVDLKCKFYTDRGDCSSGTCAGQCADSDAANTNYSNWEKQRGTECEMRLKMGCFENNNHLGESDRCTQHKGQSACLAQTKDCSEGTCSGTATSGTACSSRISEHDCNSGGCTWKKQCCKWLPTPADKEDTCMNKGKGTLSGVCSYSDGVGPPTKETVQAGFEHKLFAKSEKFNGKCALVASFRNGSGSATILGSNKADLVARGCMGNARWKALAEHVGHNDSTIEQYCAKFIPEASTMSAFKEHSPAFIIEKVEQGQFDALFPGLSGLKYLVTAKPEFGKCFFVAEDGKWGASACICDKAECNGQSALELIVDKSAGPMRLLQFIDGSLLRWKDQVNSIVAGLFSAKGKLNPDAVGKVTRADVVKIMKLDGLSAKTTVDELWNVTQDYQKLVKAETDYKAAVMAYPIFKALKINTSTVTAANTAAGVPLYFNDGVPMTLSLQNLSQAQMTALAKSTGLPEAHIKAGKLQAWNKEHGIALTTTTSTTTTTTTAISTGKAPAVVTSTGKIEIKMSKADATAFAAKPKAKAAFASAIAKTISVPASDVEITAIYVDGVKVASRRLNADSTIRVDWKVKAKVAIEAASINAVALKSNIVSEAKAVADLDISVTETPAVTTDPADGATGSTPPLFLGPLVFACIIFLSMR